MNDDNVPWGRTRKDGEPSEQFLRPGADTNVTPDMLSAGIEGYFRIPPIWVGTPLNLAQLSNSQPPNPHELVYEAKLECGILVRVLRDGTFLFNFVDFPPMPQVVIPGWVRPKEGRCKVPKENTAQENRAEDIAIDRARLMNVHQACLSTAELLLYRRTGGMGLPITNWESFKLLNRDELPGYGDSQHVYRNLVRERANGVLQRSTTNQIHRRVFELELIAESFKLLDQIILDADPIALSVIDSLYQATWHASDTRLGEAISVSWSACEQLVTVLWNNMITDERQSQSSTYRMPKERRKKLSGRDYTISVMIEFLELKRLIDHELYRSLEIARKARNRWAHELRPPPRSQVSVSIRAGEKLLQSVLGIPLHLQQQHYGGVPQWPVWMKQG